MKPRVTRRTILLLIAFCAACILGFVLNAYLHWGLPVSRLFVALIAMPAWIFTVNALLTRQGARRT